MARGGKRALAELRPEQVQALGLLARGEGGEDAAAARAQAAADEDDGAGGGKRRRREAAEDEAAGREDAQRSRREAYEAQEEDLLRKLDGKIGRARLRSRRHLGDLVFLRQPRRSASVRREVEYGGPGSVVGQRVRAKLQQQAIMMLLRQHPEIFQVVRGGGGEMTDEEEDDDGEINGWGRKPKTVEDLYNEIADEEDMERVEEEGLEDSDTVRRLRLRRARYCDDPLQADEADGGGNEAKDAATRRPRNVLDEFPDLRTHRARGLTFAVESCAPSDKMDPDLLEACVDLTERNMRDAYVAAKWKWDREKKRAQLAKKTSRFVVARHKDSGALAAFVNFRFILEDQALVLYVYEIQVDQASAGKAGLGSFLMLLMERVARYWEMDWLMLTCFCANEPALHFYDKLGFDVDETSPEGKAHVILSKQLFLEDEASGGDDDASGSEASVEDFLVTRFLLAAETGNAERVAEMLDHGAVSSPDVTSSCEEAFTPLILAAREGHLETVELLLKRGASPLGHAGARHFPLRAAALGGHLEICKRLIAAGADVNQPSAGNRTPLHGAALRNREGVLQFLLEAGADTSVVNDFGETALDIAKLNSFQSCVALLLPFAGSTRATRGSLP